MVSAIDRAKRALIALVKTLAAVYNVVINLRYRPPVHVARRRCCWSSFLSVVVVVSVVVARRPSSSVAFVVGRRCAKSRSGPGSDDVCLFVVFVVLVLGVVVVSVR